MTTMNGRGSRQLRRQGSIDAACLTAVDYAPAMVNALHRRSTTMAWPMNRATSRVPAVSAARYAAIMASLAAYPGMMRRDRERLGLRECRAAWLIGVTVREYREMEAGERTPSVEAYERMRDVYGWPTQPGRKLRSDIQSTGRLPKRSTRDRSWKT
jgi:hypothetical protein